MIKKVLVVILVLILTTPVYADADRNEFIKNMTNLAGAIKVTKMFCKASNGVDDEFRRLAGNYGGYLDKQ